MFSISITSVQHMKNSFYHSKLKHRKTWLYAARSDALIAEDNSEIALHKQGNKPLR